MIATQQRPSSAVGSIVCQQKALQQSSARPSIRSKVSVSPNVFKKRVYQRQSTAVITYASYSANNYGPMGGDARIKVIGVGGGGGNAVNRMISSGLQV